MLKRLLLLCSIMTLLLFLSSANATTLVDTLNKRFKQADYPHNNVTIQITLQTHIADLPTGEIEDYLILAYRTQAKLVSVFKQNAWQTEDALLVESIDVGLVELELDPNRRYKGKDNLNLQVFVHACDPPNFRYRGGSLDEFFQKRILEKAEQCFTYDERLQGKNYPYQ